MAKNLKVRFNAQMCQHDSNTQPATLINCQKKLLILSYLIIARSMRVVPSGNPNLAKKVWKCGVMHRCINMLPKIIGPFLL